MREKNILITGSSGLIGAQAVEFFIQREFKVIGIDNNMRAYFFGEEASTSEIRQRLEDCYKDKYVHFAVDIRDRNAIFDVFKKFDFKLVVHTAAQPSHDWAAREPFTDFDINAAGTLNLLEAMRQFVPKAVFIFTSTNKVYGDTPNRLPLVELKTRWEIEKAHPMFEGIDETMSIDQSLHSLFGASKASADILVQEYGRYFSLKTGIFRGGCLTGPLHRGAPLHGFLAYLAKCAAKEAPYTIYGYKGKQVRDNIHSYDLVNAFWYFFQNPRCGEVYNMGGSRYSNISMQEAIAYFENVFRKKVKLVYSKDNRKGDHIWYISNVNKFKSHFPQWNYTYDIYKIMDEIAKQQTKVAA